MTTSQQDPVEPLGETHGDGETQYDPHRFTALAVVLVAAFMDLLDQTIVNVAVPSVQRDLHSSYADLQWIIAAYGLTFAVLLITGGRLGDMFGRKRMFLVGVAAFSLSSLFCGLADSSGTLIVARLLAGGSAAMMMPQVLAIIHVSFPASEIGKVIGLYGMIAGLAVVLGPVLGGVLVQADLFGLGWRSVFLVNLPVGLFAALGAVRLVRESKSPTPPTADLVGMLLACAGVGLLVYPLIQGHADNWPTWSFVMMAAAVVLLVLLVVHQRARTARNRTSLLALNLFHMRSFGSGLMVQFLFGVVMSTFFVVWTLFMQDALHWSPIHAGLSALPYSIAVALAGGVSMQVVVPRLGRRALMIGVWLMAIGFGLFAMELSWNGTGISTLELLWPPLIIGIGIGCIVAPLTNAVLTGVPLQDAGSASGLINTAGTLGGSIGVSLVGLLFSPSLATAYDYPGHGQTALWCGVVGLVAMFALMFALPKNWMAPPPN